MDTKQLMTFKVAAECLNFTRTAHRLNFAQSSVTAQIQALEREIGKPLFERLGKKMILTDSGRQFKRYADQMVHLTLEVEENISNPDALPTLTIGATESQCTYRLPSILARYKKRYPQGRLIVKPANFAEEIKEELVNGTLDLGLIMGKIQALTMLTVEPLINEEIWLLTYPKNPLAHKKPVLPRDLEKETLLLTAKGCSYRNLLEDALSQNGIFPKNIVEFVTVEAIKQCAIAGLGLAYLPAVAVRSEVRKGRLIRMNGPYTVASIPTFIAWNKNKELIPNIRYFIEAAHAAMY